MSSEQTEPIIESSALNELSQTDSAVCLFYRNPITQYQLGSRCVNLINALSLQPHIQLSEAAEAQRDAEQDLRIGGPYAPPVPLQDLVEPAVPLQNSVEPAVQSIAARTRKVGRAERLKVLAFSTFPMRLLALFIIE